MQRRSNNFNHYSARVSATLLLPLMLVLLLVTLTPNAGGLRALRSAPIDAPELKGSWPATPIAPPAPELTVWQNNRLCEKY